MQKRLQFTKEVPCTSYHYIAFPLGVMKANLSDFNVWICNKLIQTYYESATNRYVLVDDDLWSEKDHITTAQSFHITTSILQCPSFDFISLIKDMLDQNHYIGGIFDEYYIPSKPAFHSFHRAHDYLIFGYDDSKCVFNSVGYLADGQFDFFDIQFQDFFNSIVHYNFYRLSLYFYRINPRPSSLNIDHILTQIQSYLAPSSSNTIALGDESGIAVWRRLARHILEPSVQQLDVRAFRAFLEHKSIMLHRINCLERNQNHSFVGPVFEEKVKNKADFAFFLSLKYNVTRQKDLLLKLSSLINDICAQESSILSELISHFSPND